VFIEKAGALFSAISCPKASFRNLCQKTMANKTSVLFAYSAGFPIQVCQNICAKMNIHQYKSGSIVLKQQRREFIF
jgi:hypothetical protein